MRFFVVCPRGLEGPLHEELSNIVGNYQQYESLQKLGLPDDQIDLLVQNFKAVVLSPVPTKPTGGIELVGPLALAMAINLHSRIASRVLTQLAMTPYKKEDDVYKAVRGLAWEDWFSPEQTLRVDLTSHRSPLTSLNFVTLRIKDAICDRLREVTGDRPSIDTATPDIRVSAYLNETHVSVYIDTSGEALFKRGWRDEKGAAPLKENLAAGILALTGWTADQALFDPMCGSGTFLIEAAQIALQIPPGAIRAGLMDAQLEMEEVEEIVQDTVREEINVAPESPPITSVKPVWQAPIAVDTGKPIDTGLPVASTINKPFVLASPDAKRKISTYKPTRVDLVTSLQGFGFNRLKPFSKNKEQKIWTSICHHAKLMMQAHANKILKIAGSDINENMVAICRSNWRKARLPGLPMIRQVDALVANPPVFNVDSSGGVMLFNPPYGERLELKGGRGDLGEKVGRSARDPLPKNISDPEFVEFLAQFGRHLKNKFGGWQVDVLTADMGLPGQLRMKESKRTPLFNGAIECRLFRFDIRSMIENSKPVDMNKE